MERSSQRDPPSQFLLLVNRFPSPLKCYYCILVKIWFFNDVRKLLLELTQNIFCDSKVMKKSHFDIIMLSYFFVLSFFGDG